jgi:DNA-binding NarL/FixJ family response regulator
MSEHPIGGLLEAGTAVAPARILLVDDHPLIRHAVREVLAHNVDMTICGEAGDAEGAKQLLRDTQPHLVLLDVSLGDTNGLDLVPWIVAADPAIRVLVLSMHDDTPYAQRALRAGAHGYVNKRESPDTIVAAIRTVLAGKIFVNPAVRDDIPPRSPDDVVEPAS